MTEDEFDKRFTLVKNHLDDNAAEGGHMYETYGAEHDYIKSLPNDMIWTITAEGDSWCYLPGYHFVNRMGYLVTKEPWTDEMDGLELKNLGQPCSKKDITSGTAKLKKLRTLVEEMEKHPAVEAGDAVYMVEEMSDSLSNLEERIEGLCEV